MQKSKDTALRYLAMLRLIEKHPSGIEVDMIKEKLSDGGFKVSTRTIQRDLTMLKPVFRLTSFTVGRRDTA